jgi:hypothetical protein
MAATLERIESLRLANEAARHEEHVRTASPGSLTSVEDLDLKELQVHRQIRDSSTASTKATLAAIRTRREQLADEQQVAERHARAALAEVEPAYIEARDAVVAAVEAFVAAKAQAVALRHRYTSAWQVAHKLGVAGNPRIEQGGLSPQLAHEWLRQISNGPW